MEKLSKFFTLLLENFGETEIKLTFSIIKNFYEFFCVQRADVTYMNFLTQSNIQEAFQSKIHFIVVECFIVSKLN